MHYETTNIPRNILYCMWQRWQDFTRPSSITLRTSKPQCCLYSMGRHTRVVDNTTSRLLYLFFLFLIPFIKVLTDQFGLCDCILGYEIYVAAFSFFSSSSCFFFCFFFQIIISQYSSDTDYGLIRWLRRLKCWRLLFYVGFSTSLVLIQQVHS